MATITFECTSTSFRPHQRHPVRWLDWRNDFALAQRIWAVPLTHAAWADARAAGYQYAAVVEPSGVVALAAVWCYSKPAWEVAAVWTRPEARHQGYATSVVAYVTESVLSAGRLATCLTERTNLGMQRTAQRVGFYPTPRS